MGTTPTFRAASRSAFALLAIVIGTLGIYSLIAYIASWRAREFGLRAVSRGVSECALGRPFTERVTQSLRASQMSAATLAQGDSEALGCDNAAAKQACL